MSTALQDAVPLGRAAKALNLTPSELDDLIRLLDLEPHDEKCLTVEQYTRLAERLILQTIRN